MKNIKEIRQAIDVGNILVDEVERKAIIQKKQEKKKLRLLQKEMFYKRK